ncbi:hypothetical protein BKG82_18835 [Mycobacteroides chelonae]|uniref:Uncharacterized protein n=1 Tax=Mycobacteroides chelonae TaxID=1774 RepID=A0A1S1LKL5_MYCCH|nr:hypothetical protein [Mycobacteroides chelonae]OHU52323.1 hypothetical protein BKG82_18835 [Mycobacteroides chelonae]
MTETSAHATAEEQLVYERTIFINPPVTRQWVDIKLFTLPPDVDDQTALALMIAHVRYRDSYASSTFADAKTIHGPYRLSAITPETFTIADAADVDTAIRTWAEHVIRDWDDDFVSWPQAQREEMDREVYARIHRATVIYRLPDIRATAQHDWGDVVGSDAGFHEFVIIDRSAGELALVVASDD